MKNKSQKISIKNRRANFDYTFLEVYSAGIILVGTEIKSIREGNVSMVDSYCYFKNNELFIKNLNISTYNQGNIYNHEPTRERKLLLKKKEINKIQSKLSDRGLTIIPTSLFTSDRGIVKVEIAIVKERNLLIKEKI